MRTKRMTIGTLLLILAAAGVVTAAVDEIVLDDVAMLTWLEFTLSEEAEAVTSVGMRFVGSAEPAIYNCMDMGGHTWTETYWAEIIVHFGDVDDRRFEYWVYGTNSETFDVVKIVTDGTSFDWSFLADGTGAVQFELWKGWEPCGGYKAPGDLTLDRVVLTIEYDAVVDTEVSTWAAVRRLYR